MLVIALVMLVIVAAAVTLVAVIAFPHQGRDVPGSPALNSLLVKVAERTGMDRDANTPQDDRGDSDRGDRLLP